MAVSKYTMQNLADIMECKALKYQERAKVSKPKNINLALYRTETEIYWYYKGMSEAYHDCNKILQSNIK